MVCLFVLDSLVCRKYDKRLKNLELNICLVCYGFFFLLYLYYVVC